MRPDPAASDDALLDAVQRACFGYFWDHGHPTSFLARDRSTREVCTIGGTGMGLMCILTAAERGFISRAEAIARLTEMIDFLAAAERHHGVWGHFMDGATGRISPFSKLDDGADLVETAFLAVGLICVRQYFTGLAAEEAHLRRIADRLWREIDWRAHRRPGADCLFWHWSPNHGFAMNHRITGWNECLIVYLLALASPTHPVPRSAYHKGWTSGGPFRNGQSYYGLDLPLGPDLGGPLFFAHYSFLGLDPRGLVDSYADYWKQNRHHVLINRAYCEANPKGFKGYGSDCWGLTASDTIDGYTAHAPDNDRGVISPTAALASMPYTPDLSLAALRHFLAHYPQAWGEWGFRDAFSPAFDWVAEATLAIDQGPIVIMIENYRSQLLWRLFMSAAEVRRGLAALGFSSPWLAAGA
jgi:hypothetical protein